MNFPAHNLRPRRPSRRGVIFVTALWVILILGVLTLLFAQSMRTEIAAAHNRSGGELAAALVQAAENYVVGVCDAYTPGNTVSNTPGDALAIVQAPGEAIAVGNAGYFWILRSNPDDFRNYYYGISDESSKLYLNTATSEELLQLPNMDPTTVDPILDWVDADSTPKANGAESDYYAGLPRPYQAKNAGFESIEELLLVKGFAEDPLVGAQLLWGNDLNHNGVIDQNESASTTTGSSGVDFSCGLFPFLTVWATQPDTDANGAARTAVNATTNGAPAQAAAPAPAQNPGGGQQQADPKLVTALTTAGLTAQRAQQIAQSAAGQQFTSVFDFAQKTRMQDEETKKVLDTLTASSAKKLVGMMNVNTVSLGVLQCLPGLQPGDADNIIGARHNNAAGVSGGSGMEWLVGNIPAATLARVGRYVTGHSYQYSADIVAVTADGQSFRRVRIVVDAQKSPARIIYRKDLTRRGWPLPKEIRDALLSGTYQPGSVGAGVMWQP